MYVCLENWRLRQLGLVGCSTETPMSRDSPSFGGPRVGRTMWKDCALTSFTPFFPKSLPARGPDVTPPFRPGFSGLSRLRSGWTDHSLVQRKACR